ncbi:hypothetical protein B0H17DRAFT_1144342 [Mycena rosella]|uniref:Uncharacterized protein n=1 Tax=Mycena rosella TaxID=1033263 RepID=A0AAD7CTS8_MYCRO|nr:hypothetical protein B0H17DRAFT_1144342 [Mycena rosella]
MLLSWLDLGPPLPLRLCGAAPVFLLLFIKATQCDNIQSALSSVLDGGDRKVRHLRSHLKVIWFSMISRESYHAVTTGVAILAPIHEKWGTMWLYAIGHSTRVAFGHSAGNALPAYTRLDDAGLRASVKIVGCMSIGSSKKPASIYIDFRVFIGLMCLDIGRQASACGPRNRMGPWPHKIRHLNVGHSSLSPASPLSRRARGTRNFTVKNRGANLSLVSGVS